jgi:tetratricopeptide (TPR) repeat protein
MPPDVLEISVRTTTEELDEPLLSALRAHARLRRLPSRRALEVRPSDAERTTPPDLEALVAGSARAIRSGFYEASLDLARRGMLAVGEAPEHGAFAELGRNIAFSLLMLGRYVEAEAYCRKIESVTEGPALRSHCAYAMAILHARLLPLERRDYAAARAWIEKAVAFSDALPSSETKVVNTVFLDNTLALVEMRTGHHEEALRLLSHGLLRLAAEAPAKYQAESIILLHNRARIHLAMAEEERAFEDYTALLTLEPMNSEAHLDRGVLLQRLGRMAEALDDYDAAIAWSPPYVEALFNRAVALRALERGGEALADLAHVLALEPRHAGALVNRAGVLYERGELAAARQDVDRVLACEPGNAKGWCLAGLLEMAARRWPEARAAFDQALVRDDAEATARINRATLLVRDGDLAGALRDLDAVIARRPDATALANRARILRLKGRQSYPSEP